MSRKGERSDKKLAELYLRYPQDVCYYSGGGRIAENVVKTKNAEEEPLSRFLQLVRSLSCEFGNNEM